MGKTISEKILARAAGLKEASAGDIIWANVDKAMMDDILGPRVVIAEKLKELNQKIWNPEKVVVISDHYTPPASIQQAEIVKFTRDWSAEYGIKNYYEFVGPCHQNMVENGHILPGTVVVGTDSHTCMGGAFGAFSTGIGSTEMLAVLVKGQIWLKIPETVRICCEGILPSRVYAKDIALRIAQLLGHAGATYQAVEYCGDAVRALSMDERMAISNMAVECGAKAGLIQPDEKAVQYLQEKGFTVPDVSWIYSDEDALYARRETINVSELQPLVACPHAVDNVAPAADLHDTAIHQVYIGSCTGGRLSDLQFAAEILKDKKIHSGIRMLVSPASDKVWREASKRGILQTLADAGASILAPTCGICVGVHSGLLAGGERCISTTNRNFMGRMGSKDSQIYLSSAATAAASAITGRITDPREIRD